MFQDYRKRQHKQYAVHVRAHPDWRWKDTRKPVGNGWWSVLPSELPVDSWTALETFLRGDAWAFWEWQYDRMRPLDIRLVSEEGRVWWSLTFSRTEIIVQPPRDSWWQRWIWRNRERALRWSSPAHRLIWKRR